MGNASERRGAAVRALVDRYFPDGKMIMASRVDMADEITALRGMGRTDRWRNAIDAWARMVRDITSAQDWALLQYSVFAAHAAD